MQSTVRFRTPRLPRIHRFAYYIGQPIYGTNGLLWRACNGLHKIRVFCTVEPSLTPQGVEGSIRTIRIQPWVCIYKRVQIVRLTRETVTWIIRYQESTRGTNGFHGEV